MSSGYPESRLTASASNMGRFPTFFGGSSSCFYSEISNDVSPFPGPRVIGSPVRVMWRTKHVASRRGSGQSAFDRRDPESLRSQFLWGGKSSVLYNCLQYHYVRAFEHAVLFSPPPLPAPSHAAIASHDRQWRLNY